MNKISLEVSLNHCHCCNTAMLPMLPPEWFQHVAPQASQMAALGVSVQSSETTPEGDRLCVNCEDSEEVKYLCALCHAHKPYSEVETSAGSRFLCSQCFGTVTAKVWQETIFGLDGKD